MSESARLIVLSAQNEQRLLAYIEKLIAFLDSDQQSDAESARLDNIAYTLQVGRVALDMRIALVVNSVNELRNTLHLLLNQHQKSNDSSKERGNPLIAVRSPLVTSEATENDTQNQEQNNTQKNKPFTAIPEASQLTREQQTQLPMQALQWLETGNADWDALYVASDSDKPRRISLPTYAFAPDPYWFTPNQTVKLTSGGASDQTANTTALAENAARFLFPLAQRNISSLHELGFSSEFTGQEPFLKHHQVNGNPVLPGVAYLEMVHSAIAQLVGETTMAQYTLSITNVVWLQPFTIDDESTSSIHSSDIRKTKDIYIDVNPLEERRFEIDIFRSDISYSEALAGKDSSKEDSSTEHAPKETLFCQCDVLLQDNTRVSGATPSKASSQIQEVLSRYSLEKSQQINIEKINTQQINVNKIYQSYTASGLNYGDSHRGLASVSVSVDPQTGFKHVVAELDLKQAGAEPNGLANTALPPGVLDSALQAAIGLIWPEEKILNETDLSDSHSSLPLTLPFALEKVQVHQAIPASLDPQKQETLQAWVRYSDGFGPDDSVEKLDIDLFVTRADANGSYDSSSYESASDLSKETTTQLLVQMQGFTARKLSGESGVTNQDQSQEHKQEQSTGSDADSGQPLADAETHLYQQQWQSVELSSERATSEKAHSNSESVQVDEIIVIGDGFAFESAFESGSDSTRISHIPLTPIANSENANPPGEIAKHYSNVTQQLLTLLQQRLQTLAAQPAQQQFIQVVFSEAAIGELAPMLWGLGGMCRTVSSESPRLQVQLVGIQTLEKGSNDLPANLLQQADLLKLAAQSGYRELRLANVTVNSNSTSSNRANLDKSNAQIRRFQRINQSINQRISKQALPPETEAETETQQHHWQPGVFLITGGMGGLGYLFAQHIASVLGGEPDSALDATLNQTLSQTTIVLTGRSAASSATESKLQQLRDRGVQAEYRVMDVCNAAEVSGVIAQIIATHQQLNTVIHAAGVIADQFLINKNLSNITNVLAPKVQGVVNLDNATQNIALHAFIAFSSTSALVSAGQTDYVAANGFMDGYLTQRQQRVNAGTRSGVSLAINWPLWAADVSGMTVDAVVLKQMRAEGWDVLPGNIGLAAMQQSLAFATQHQQAQTWVFTGKPDATRAFLAESELLGTELAKGQSTEQEDESQTQEQEQKQAQQDKLAKQALAYFRQQMAEALRLPVERIDVNAPMEKYGIDSVMVMQLTAMLEETFGTLSKTLFFEVQTIRALSDYFMVHFHKKLHAMLGDKIGAVKSQANSQSKQTEIKQTAPTNPQPTASEGAGSVRRRYLKSRQKSKQTPNQQGLWQSASFEHHSGHTQSSQIAIIGLAGRYPQAPDLDTFWQNLTEGRDCITEIPADRWEHNLFFDADNKDGFTNSKWGGFIDGVDQFDPLFFGISPREAALLDPQERLFLECVYHTLEDAGYTRAELAARQSKSNANAANGSTLSGSTLSGSTLSGNVGVFVGVMYQEYQLYGAQAQQSGNSIALGGNPSSIANRVSYFCNWIGPSLAVDTMCSSSLTALHLAVNSIRTGVCDMAIAGGVNVTVHPNKYLMLSQDNFTASNGRCMSFGEGGDGYVPGEGVGAVLLKRLEEAESEGDHIYGVVRGTAVNHGGKTNGFTVPNPIAQEDVIVKALNDANVSPEQISYIEAHGTGTSLGDPIEIAGLSNAFARATGEPSRRENDKCRIGSVKSNIGHLESAAGIAGLSKILLQFKHQQIVPSIHSDTLNPHIDFDATPFVVNRENSPWETEQEDQGQPRIAAISSFGAGGSNAHVIVEAYSPVQTAIQKETRSESQPVAIVLSAHSDAQLHQQAQLLHRAITAGKYQQHDIAAIAYTLQVGREVFDERVGWQVQNLDDLKQALSDFLQNQPDTRCYRGSLKQGMSQGAGSDILASVQHATHFQTMLNEWAEQGDFGQLLHLWVNGVEINWAGFYGHLDTNSDREPNTPQRISLPAYPFERERHWPDALPQPTLGQSANRAGAENLAGGTVLHELVQHNKSDAYELKFVSQFNGSEPFLRDHQVQQHGVLPGVAYLEMALTAAQQVLQPDAPFSSLTISDLVWLQPIAVDTAESANNNNQEHETVAVDIVVDPLSEQQADVLFCAPEDGQEPEQEPLIYSECSVDLTPVEADFNNEPLSDRAYWDRHLNSGQNIDIDALYQQYANSGLHYGDSQNGTREVFAEIDLQDQYSVNQYKSNQTSNLVLPPGILDSALQAAIGLSWFNDSGEVRKNIPLSLPFSLERTIVSDSFANANSNIHGGKLRVWIRHASDVEEANTNKASTRLKTESVEKLDIDLLVDASQQETSGKLTPIVQFRGFTSRQVDAQAFAQAAAKSGTQSKISQSQPLADAETQLFKQQWHTVALNEQAKSWNSDREIDRVIVLDKTFHERLYKALQQSAPNDKLPFEYSAIEVQTSASKTDAKTEPAEAAFANQYQQLTTALLQLLQQQLKTQNQGNSKLIQLIFDTSQPYSELLWGLTGVCRTVSEENPALQLQLIGLENAAVKANDKSKNKHIKLKKMLKLAAKSSYRELKITNNAQKLVAQSRELVTLEQKQSQEGNRWNEQPGVYLITGGLGGLGYLFALQLTQAELAQAEHANANTDTVLILTGRSPLSRASRIPTIRRYRRRASGRCSGAHC